MYKLMNQPNFKNSFSAKLLLCVFATIIALYSHRYFPEKHLKIHTTNGENFWLYGDKKIDGNQSATWTDKNQIAWMCDIEYDDNSHHVCGLGTSLGNGIGSSGLDLSGYNRVNIELEYKGPDKRIRFYTRNYLEGFSNINDVDTAQFVNILLPTNELNKPLTIELSKFLVAEWWISAYDAPLNLMYPKFSNSIVLGIDLHYPSTPGKHYYKLKSLEFSGLWITKETWYLGILIFWMTLIVTGGAYNLWKLTRQLDSEHKTIEALITSHSTLETKTKHYRQLSITDQLTGLMSRHGLSEFVEACIDKNTAPKISIILIDIDFFKKINDTYGHERGDSVLQRVANTIQENIAADDIAARWGGEEFIVLSTVTDIENILRLAEKLRAATERIEFANLPALKITISLGVGVLHNSEPFHKLFKRVDIALYSAKNNGRNRIELAKI